MAHSEEIGGPTAIVDRACAAADSLPSEVVYVGFSLGMLAAQSLAQIRSGARGAVLCDGPVGRQLAGDVAEGVRLQLHILAGDEDFEFAQELAATAHTLLDAVRDELR